MPLALPYPGFSWQMGHHMGPAVRSDGPFVRTAYELLRTAFRFAGQPDFEERLNKDIATRGLLPPNVRTGAHGRGKSDIWRDYQQVLAELGLIYSTRFRPALTITPAGLQLISGAVGFSEVLTAQSLRYQYPNGQKAVSQDLRSLLPRSLASLATLAEIDAVSGVQIKPGVMLLRLLVELLSYPEEVQVIRPAEILEAVVPVKTNADWPIALKNLLKIRKSARPARGDGADTRRPRHIDEWFRLLGGTDLFQILPNRKLSLALSANARNNILKVKQLCDHHENPATFWLPSSQLAADLGISWFDYYGSISLDEQWIEAELTPSYIEQNFPGGQELVDDAEEDRAARDTTAALGLIPFAITGGSIPAVPSGSPSRSAEELGLQTLLGIEKRQAQTVLHEEIVQLAAKKLGSEGFTLSFDRNSIDLFAHSSRADTIIEVKTVTARNLIPRLRLGVGQLSEYCYRHSLRKPKVPVKSLLLISSSGSLPPWLTDYFAKHINVGLVGLVRRDSFRAYTSGVVETALAK